MSNAVFPTLAGISWNVLKNPMFVTKTQQATSGKQTRVAYMTYPIWQFTLSYEVLRDTAGNDELNTIRDFFLARQGAYDSFLYSDPDESSVTAQSFGTGDGTTTAFQLIRPIKSAGFNEPIQNLNGSPSIYINGVLKTITTDYTISTLGVVTFVTPPALGAALTWTGSYYYRVHFIKDVTELNEFMNKLWELKKLEFESVKL